VRTLSRLSITPVKGMALQHPLHAELGPAGISGSRLFYMIDAAGALFSGGAFGPLVRVRPVYDPAASRLSLTFRTAGWSRRMRPPPALLSRPTSMDGRSGPGRSPRPVGAISAFVGARSGWCAASATGRVDVHPLTVISNASVADLAARGGFAASSTPAGSGSTSRSTAANLTTRMAGATGGSDRSAVVRILGPIPAAW